MKKGLKLMLACISIGILCASACSDGDDQDNSGTTASIINETNNSPSPTGYKAEKIGDSVFDTVYDLEEVKSADVIFIAVQHDTGTGCEFYAYKKSDGKYKAEWSVTGYVGRSGVGDPAKRHEGDGTSPAGVYSLGECFGIYAAPEGMSLPYTKVTEDDYWDGDSSSPTYNQHVKGSEMPKSWSAADSEHLIDYKNSYNYAAMINFNIDPTVPKKGSCIFLHCTNPGSKSSAGCIAIPEEYMIKALQLMTEKSYIIIAGSTDDLSKVGEY